MESMFANPIMLDDLDFLYKNDMARKVLFFYQAKGDEVEPEEDTSRKKDPRERKNQGLAVLASKDKEADEEGEDAMDEGKNLGVERSRIDSP